MFAGCKLAQLLSLVERFWNQLQFFISSAGNQALERKTTVCIRIQSTTRASASSNPEHATAGCTYAAVYASSMQSELCLPTIERHIFYLARQVQPVFNQPGYGQTGGYAQPVQVRSCA